jgi:pimeloyl-ACP methyl ester carboxylesterase
MKDISTIDYSALDQPEVLMFLFHPRQEVGLYGSESSAEEMLIPVENDVEIGARFHMAKKAFHNVLFFHGNGEIVADYDDLGPVYNKMGLNFLAVDYRGYGRSTGNPTVTSMMCDCHLIFDYVTNWLDTNGYSGSLIIMGRSLGSASAIELASSYKDQVSGLILESGFAYAGPLLQLLGINLKSLKFSENDGFQNIDKIKTFNKPTLIIHAEQDHIIPITDGEALHSASQAIDKMLLKIPNANHNDIFARGLSEYMTSVKKLADKASEYKNT